MEYLKRVEPYLLPRCDAFDLWMMCLDGHAILWGAFTDEVDGDTLNESLRGAVVTRITSYPKGDMLTIPALAGDDVDDWLDLAYERLTAFWKDNGFLGLEEWGRDGWIRKLRKYGFRKSCVLMEDTHGQGKRWPDPDNLDSNAE